MMEIEGLSFKAACAELRIEAEGSDRPCGYRLVRVPRQTRDNAFAPSRYAPPSALWREHVTKLALDAHERLLQTPLIAVSGQARSVRRCRAGAYRLGYIEAEGRRPDCIYRSRSAFDLPKKLEGGRGQGYSGLAHFARYNHFI